MARDSRRKASGQTAKVKWLRRAFFAIAGAVAMFVVIFVLAVELTPFDASKLASGHNPTIVYAKDGSEFMTIPGSGGDDLTYNQVPKNLQNALVAIEDHNFWNSSSIDAKGLLRAAFIDLWTQRLAQGGSTIQEQLAKIVYLNDKKTFGRKFKQITLGVQINRQFTKQEILAMYLNRVYLGENTTGVEDAANRYFGVDLKTNPGQLTLDQAALLAGLPQAPSAYDPVQHPEAAIKRRNEVLEAMAKYGYITEQQAKAAEQKKLSVSYHKIPGNAWDSHPLFTNFLFDYARQEGISAEELSQGGLKIYTTVDPKVQSAIETVFWNSNYHHAFRGPTTGTVVQGAALFVDPKTGGILGGAGSRKQGFVYFGMDRIYAMRQPGSSIKPVLDYAPAVETGKYGPDTILNNTPHNFGGNYVPHNDEANSPAQVNMQYAIQMSQNVAAVSMLQMIGINTGADFAAKDGIEITPNDRQHLGIAIGGLEKGVSPFQMAQAYEPFANQGIQMKAHLITKIVNDSGDTIYTFTPVAKQIMSARTAQIMTQMMQTVVTGGTGQPAQVPNWDVAGKTGTVQYDPGQSGAHHNWISSAWFDGYTPTMVGSIYMGYDVPSAEHHMTDVPYSPSWNCAQLFGDITKLAVQGEQPQQFDYTIPAAPGTDTGVPVTQLSASWDQVTHALQLTWKSTMQNKNLYFIIKRSGPTPISGSSGGGAGSSGSGDMTVVGQTNQPYFEDTQVQPGNAYTYTVQAVDSSNGSVLSPAQTVTVNIASDVQPPPGPPDNQTGNTPSPGNSTGGTPTPTPPGNVTPPGTKP